MVPGYVHYCERAPGPDGIISKMLKNGGNRMVEMLCSLVNLVM